MNLFIDETPAIFSTWNPADKDPDVVLSSGDTVASVTAANGAVRGTLGHSSGVHQCEIVVGGGPVSLLGLGDASATLAAYVGSDPHGWAYYGNSGEKYVNNVGLSYGATYGNGDVIGIVWDAGAGTITFYKNGVSQGVAFTGLSGTLYPMWGPGTGGAGTRTATLNTGAGAGLAYPVVGATAWG